MTWDDARKTYLLEKRLGKDPLMVNTSLLPGPVHAWSEDFHVVDRIKYQKRCREIGHEPACIELGTVQDD